MTWIEPTRGSTVGVADAFMAVRDRFVALELKCARPSLPGHPIIVDFRPVQRHWHGWATMTGIQTFALIASNSSPRDPSQVWLIDMASVEASSPLKGPVVIPADKYYDAYRKPLSSGGKLQWALGHRAAWVDTGPCLII